METLEAELVELVERRALPPEAADELRDRYTFCAPAWAEMRVDSSEAFLEAALAAGEPLAAFLVHTEKAFPSADNLAETTEKLGAALALQDPTAMSRAALVLNLYASELRDDDVLAENLEATWEILACRFHDGCDPEVQRLEQADRFVAWRFAEIEEEAVRIEALIRGGSVRNHDFLSWGGG